MYWWLYRFEAGELLSSRNSQATRKMAKDRWCKRGIFRWLIFFVCFWIKIEFCTKSTKLFCTPNINYNINVQNINTIKIYVWQRCREETYVVKLQDLILEIFCLKHSNWSIEIDSNKIKVSININSRYYMI